MWDGYSSTATDIDVDHTHVPPPIRSFLLFAALLLPCTLGHEPVEMHTHWHRWSGFIHRPVRSRCFYTSQKGTHFLFLELEHIPTRKMSRFHWHFVQVILALTNRMLLSNSRHQGLTTYFKFLQLMSCNHHYVRQQHSSWTGLSGFVASFCI